MSERRMALLSADTTADIERRQVEAWRRLSSVERLRLVSDATRAVMALSLAGIRRRHPQASDRECFLRLAAIRLGVDATRQVYPDAAHLPDLAVGERPRRGRAQRVADPRKRLREGPYQPDRYSRLRNWLAHGMLVTRMLAPSYSIFRPARSETMPRSMTSVRRAA